MKENLKQLKETVERMHECTAKLMGTVYVAETFQEKTVWQDVVYIFNIMGNPLAKRCYAWSSPIEGSSKRRFFAVLETPPIKSAQDAVKASIVYSSRI
ncbi:MAG: hypothetical protein WA666_03080 [Nitrospirota bacterium]